MLRITTAFPSAWNTLPFTHSRTVHSTYIRISGISWPTIDCNYDSLPFQGRCLPRLYAYARNPAVSWCEQMPSRLKELTDDETEILEGLKEWHSTARYETPTSLSCDLDSMPQYGLQLLFMMPTTFPEGFTDFFSAVCNCNKGLQLGHLREKIFIFKY